MSSKSQEIVLIKVNNHTTNKCFKTIKVTMKFGLLNNKKVLEIHNFKFS